jgi:protein phosphatase
MLVQFKNGKAMVERHGAQGFVPGPPFPRTHESSRVAYSRMSMLAQVSLADALQQRYELFLAFTHDQMKSLPPIKQVAFEMSDEVDIETERVFFGNGPTPGNEKAFFAAIAEGGR